MISVGIISLEKVVEKNKRQRTAWRGGAEIRAEAEKREKTGSTGREEAKEQCSVIWTASLERDCSAHVPARDQCTP